MGDAAAVSSATEKAAEAAGGVSEKAGGFLERIGDIISATQIPKQISEVDAGGLLTNPWFMVPFVAFMGWQFYRQAFNDIIVVLLIFAVWWVSGTPYMQTLVVDGELQISKILPVMFGGAAVLGFIIYIYFGRS